MKRPILRHIQCPNAQVGDKHPRMAEDFEKAQVFLDGQAIVVRIPYVCPECGYVVQVDRR